MTIDRQSARWVVDSRSLATGLVRDACLSACRDIPMALAGGSPEFNQSPLGRLLHSSTAAPFPLENDGLTRSPRSGIQGAALTADLCPSSRPLDRAFLASLPVGSPIAIAISGGWIRRHGADLSWLKQRIAAGQLHVTWANHSLTHPYHRGVPIDQTFLLTPGLRFDNEVLGQEQMMISRGLTPSVYFRFPGLVSNQRQVTTLESWGLVTLGADAWLALGRRPANGSIMLIHINGNEPEGLTRYQTLSARGQLPRPALLINDIP